MKKILLIEDDKLLCETTAEFLEYSDFEVITAVNGADGIQKALVETPDLIICDISMPQLDGYEVFRTLQQNRYTSVIPFIFLTAKAEKGDVRTGMQLGVDDYITKPFDLDDLLLSINTRLQKQEKMQRISDEKFSSIVDNSPYGVIICYDTNRIYYSNENVSKLLYYSPAELVNKSIDVLFSLQNGNIKDKLAICYRGLKKMTIDCIGHAQNGKRLPLQLFCSSTRINGQNAVIINVLDSTKAERNAEKIIPPDDIESAVQVLETNKEAITKDLIIKLKEIFKSTTKKQQSNLIKLTRRELEVLELVCKGDSNVEIADKLFISYRTVERHRTNLINKTESKNIIEVVIYAIRNDLINVE